MTDQPKYDVIVVGAGLAGLSCSMEMVENGYKLLLVEAEQFVGGRTSSWVEAGMHVESGFHRVIGFQENLQSLLTHANIDVDTIVKWEKNFEVRSPAKQHSLVMGVGPVYAPIKMLKGILGNNKTLSLTAKLSAGLFFMKGLMAYRRAPEELDQISIHEYAIDSGLHEDAYHMLLIPLSAGLFFLPPERYSAYVFFGLMAPAIPKFYKMGVGAFLGGMTDVMTGPIAEAVKKKGGEILLGDRVDRILTDGDRVTGVKVKNKEFTAKEVVLATDLGSTKKVLSASGIEEKFPDLLKLPTMPAVTVQIELDQPMLPIDRTTFGTGTALVSFAEQSRTTFTHVPGRLSIILGPAEKFLELSPEQIMESVIEEAKKIHIDLKPHITDYRIVSHPEDFFTLEPGYSKVRPDQKTPLTGFTLAGDYTWQPFFATMEGAVVSGKKAATCVLENLGDK